MATLASPASATDEIVLPSGFEAASIGDNGFLSKPIAVEFAPDGRVFVLDEGYGTGPGTTDGPQVKVKLPGSSVYKRLFRFDRVNTKQDRGMVGMALDKDFGTPGNNYMYLLYTYEPSGGPSNSEAARTQRLTRVTVPDVIPATPEEPVETVLLGSVGTPVSATQACPYPKTAEGDFDPNGSWEPFDHTDCIPSDATEHAVDTVVVDPNDGTLWVAIGDGGAGGDFPDPLAFRAQAIDSLAGKLLHVDRNGKGLPTNGTCPGVTDFDRICTKVYARGLRNPFRLSLRPGGEIAIGDPGWKTREEIDLLDSGGANLGWPCYEGSVQTPLWKDRPECKAFYAAATPHQAPIYDYSYPPETFGAAVILGPTYLGTGEISDYPDEYSGGLFFSDFVSGKASYLKLDSSGSLVSGYPKAFGALPEVVDWETAPSGDLVYVDIGFGATNGDSVPSIGQISAVENRRPVAKIDLSGAPYGDIPFNANFDGSGSTDPDPGETATLIYAWDLDGDGEFDDSEAANPPTHEYLDGTKNVVAKLKVTDVHGKSDVATIELWPGDNPPEAPSMDPGNPDTYRGGELVELAGSSSDPDPGDAATLNWSVVINHNGTHSHDLGTGTGDTFSFNTDTVHDQPSTYEVAVSAIDERGLETSLPILELEPETAELELTSAPSGAEVNHGGVDHVTPYTGVSTIGVQVGISAEESFFSDGSPFEFQAWSNSGPRSQTLTMPPGGLSLNASYSGQYQLSVAKNGSGSGTVTSSPAGINCGSECSAEYDEGTTVILAGAPGINTKAVQWTGCDSVNGENKCVVAMSAVKKVTATFGLETRQLTVNKEGLGTGVVTSAPAGIECDPICSASFDHGSDVTLSANAEAGSAFSGWSGGGCSGAVGCKVTMSAAREVTATFDLALIPDSPFGGDAFEAKPIDAVAARLRFNPTHGLVSGRSLLRGTAEDESGVRRVQVALRKEKKQRGRCQWWSRQRGRLSAPSSCAKPAFMQTQLKGGGEEVPWTLSLGGKLPAGRYLLFFRTEDEAGNVGAGPSGAKQVPLRVK
jgi:glucose/arabinose dehydrogenase